MLGPIFPAYYLFNSLLCLLLCLHLVWTWLILQVAIKSIGSGQVITVFLQPFYPTAEEWGLCFWSVCIYVSVCRFFFYVSGVNVCVCT